MMGAKEWVFLGYAILMLFVIWKIENRKDK